MGFLTDYEILLSFENPQFRWNEKLASKIRYVRTNEKYLYDEWNSYFEFLITGAFKLKRIDNEALLLTINKTLKGLKTSFLKKKNHDSNWTSRYDELFIISRLGLVLGVQLSAILVKFNECYAHLVEENGDPILKKIERVPCRYMCT